MPNTREKLIEVKKALGICYKEGLTGECKGCTYKGKNSICMDALMEDALAVINHLESNVPSKWIPVTERLPEKAGTYIVHGNLGGVFGLFYDDILSNSFKQMVTHWMPLPEAPKGE